MIDFNSERNWPNEEQYQNTCKGCGEQFIGIRYRRCCVKCAENIRPLNQIEQTKPYLHPEKYKDFLYQMGISEDQYNNDPVTHAVVSMLINGDKPLQVLGYMVDNFIRYQKEVADIVAKFPSHTIIKIDDKQLPTDSLPSEI